MLTVDELVELAKEVEHEDPIDWGMLNINEDDAFRLVALSVIEYPNKIDPKLLPTTLLATIVKLSVENFVLNVKLLQNAKERL